MVLQKNEPGVSGALVGADVYTRDGRPVGRIVEAGERCFKLVLEGGPVIWLGRQMVVAVQETRVILSSDLLRKHASIHDGIHLHVGSA